ncbi:MAG: LPS assembly protein LptD [Pseudomonadota bacterium]|nr:LPS assembly protein LptD [Pseudomonadota bacterium]
MKKHLFVYFLALSAFSIQADGVNLTCTPYQSCVNCPEYQTLFPIKQFSADYSSVEVEADQSEITENDEYLLSGNVQLKSGDYLLSADEVEFSSSNQSTIARGNIEYQDTEYLITGDNFSGIKENGQTKAKINDTRYQEIKNNANGIAESISKEGDIVVFNKATYSYCPINQNDWHVYANKIRANFDTNRGVADNATLVFKGFPMFYVPIFSWVLEGRGSGFLAPDFDTYGEHIGNTRESKVRIPYYFNIAPDRDLVLAYTQLSSRGSVIEAKYRQLIDRKETKDEIIDRTFEIESQYLFNDNIRKINRWLVDASTELDISNNIHLSARYNKVSDKNYFKEILHRNTDAERLNSHLKISYKYPKMNLKAEFLTEDEQIVNDGSSNYTRAIQASVSKRFNVEGAIPYGVSIITTKFKHDDANKDSGIRIHGTIGASKNLSSKFPIIDSSVNATSTLYSLNNKDNITRTTFGGALDFTFPFISQREFFNTQTTRKITPKITYNYRGKVVQGNIPIFDTTDKYDETITFAGLTSGERYTGLDRISNANDVTLSLVTSYSDLNSNKELFNFRIAQSYYADDEVVSNDTDTDFEKRRSYSDVAAGIDLAVNKFAYNSSLQFDPEITKVTNRTNTISYKLNPKKFVSLTHSKDDSTSTVKLYGAYPINDSIHLFGAIDQNTTTGKTNKATAGVTYDSCCWAMRGAYFREGLSNHGIGFEIILKGIGSSSTNLGKRLKNNIPYYEANLDE